MKRHQRTLIILLLAVFGSLHTASQAQNRILLIEANGVINPVKAEYIIDAVDRAHEEDFHALIIQMDTPGGLLESTRRITKSLLSARIPVIIYVGPTGARAASAGVFISYAAHLVAMAPATNIGAAHPVNSMGGGGDSTQTTMMEKVTNDAVAQIKSMAEKRDRNVQWAEDAIRKSVSITETEALALNVINFISPSIDSLLQTIDGIAVTTEDGVVTLATKDAQVERAPMSLRDTILDLLTSNPNLTYMLLMLGFYGLYFELSNPGSIFPGTVGAISLILAFYSMQTLPVNYAGLLLIVIALILFILEIKIVSHGLLSIGGIISMAIGSLMLFKQPEDFMSPLLEVSYTLIFAFTLITALFFIFIIGFALKARAQKVTTGLEDLIGETGEARTNIATAGHVLIRGELWSANCDIPLTKGDRVQVMEVDGLTVKVKKI